MKIEYIDCEFKKVRLQACGPDEVVSFKLIVTVNTGSKLIDVDLWQDIGDIEQLAFNKVIEKLNVLQTT